ncbi:transcriptional regulator [Scytonema sp. UIC 10036]|uniref:helix-turn-helix domain-containing transcriptional regulator n=1 Tax=Scytonema sp. UIC 10036 TaxID=2304196 RepID=UPI0012DA9FBE|nr:transcriptional regulator [Scytonema sp. UIC 10036]MUG92715.1 transcriptional regulator [Scytonema sp. UIC 10036]
MKEVKAATSSSYREYLISSLKDTEHAAAYIAVMLELDEEGYDPKLLRAALNNVMEARLQANNLSETAKQHYEKLDKILAETGGAQIYTLIEFLDALGYQIALASKDDNSFPENEPQHS